MGQKTRIVIGLFCCFFVVFAFAVPAAFSDKYYDVKKLNVLVKGRSSVRTTSKSSGSQKMKWTELRLEFDSKVKWTDDLTVKYFALVKDGNEGEVLSGSISYLQVPAGKKHISSLFVHPAILAKYGKIDALHCEIWVKGKIRALADYPSRPQKKWWEMKPPIEGLLVNKFFTPYLLDPEYDELAIRMLQQ